MELNTLTYTWSAQGQVLILRDTAAWTSAVSKVILHVLELVFHLIMEGSLISLLSFPSFQTDTLEACQA